MQLLERTRKLISQSLDSGMSLRALAESLGGSEKQISRRFEWLRKFRAGKIDNPGVNTIQELHDSLSNRKKPS